MPLTVEELQKVPLPVLLSAIMNHADMPDYLWGAFDLVLERMPRTTAYSPNDIATRLFEHSRYNRVFQPLRLVDVIGPDELTSKAS